MTLEKELEVYFDKLWPIIRSLTGNGNRETLRVLSQIIPLNIHEIASGTTCFDWTVPPEWNPKEAWIKNGAGEIFIDFRSNNLHLLGYSESFQGRLTGKQLKPHLYTLPNNPDWVPYVVSYYKRRWGFCISHNQLNQIDDNDIYEININVDINSEGSLTYGDLVLKGETDNEVLLSTYICHPAMANDQLSGMLVTAFLYRELSKIKSRHYTYRFVFVPETIGAIAYLYENGKYMKEHTRAGFVVTCVGDSGNFTFKQTKHSGTLTNKATLQVLEELGQPYKIVPFMPLGSDERQYSSPGFDLPVGSLMRTMYWNYQQYHTSADNKQFMCFKSMAESVDVYLKIFRLIECNRKYINLKPYGEVQLGKRGLYPTLGRGNDKEEIVEAYQWLLNFSDGNHDIIDIAQRSKKSTILLAQAAENLMSQGLLEVINEDLED